MIPIGGPADPGRIDREAPRLRVLQEARHEFRLHGIGPLDEPLGVVNDRGAEDAAEERPGCFTRLDGGRGRLPEDRVDEAVARADGGEDPRPEAAPLAEQVALQERHPAGVDLHFRAGGAVGDRDGRRRPPEPKLSQREAAERGVADRDALAAQQLADPGEPDAVREVARDEVAVCRAHRPALPPRPPRSRLDRRHHRRDEGVVEPREPGSAASPDVGATPRARAAATYRRTVFTSKLSC